MFTEEHHLQKIFNLGITTLEDTGMGNGEYKYLQ